MLRVISPRAAPVWRNANPVRVVVGLWSHRELIRQLIRRDVRERYNASLLGFSWSILSPLGLLAVYTFVFSTVLHSRWPGTAGTNPTDFAVIVFAGLVPYSFFSETIVRAPDLIVAVPNYVRRVVFPVEVLPVSILGSILLQSIGRVMILLAAVLITRGTLEWTVILLPVVVVPLILLTLGLTWMLAGLGVFVRDISHSLGLFLQVLFFATPIVYPLESVPEPWAAFIRVNPLTSIVESMRLVVVWGQVPEWTGLGVWAVVDLAVAWLGYLWFMRLKSAFADVL